MLTAIKDFKKTRPCAPRLLVVGFMLRVALASAQNLAQNPGFETGDTSGWFAFGPPAISAQTNFVHSGSYAGLVTNRTDTWNGIAQSFLGKLQAGQTYNISAWLLLAGGTNQTMALTMQQEDGSGTNYTWVTSGSVSTNGWTRFSGQWTFNPSGTVSALTLYAEVPSSSNAAYYIDDLVVQPQNVTNAQCVVTWTNTFQRIDGFGASSAWDSSWTTNQADMYFSTNSGMGTSVDGTSNFPFNGIALSLLRNRIAPDGTSVETNLMQMAQARGARVWSTPWTPPPVYKDTNSVNGGNFVSSPSNFQGYANYLAGYVASMKTNYGISLYAVSVQNEPDENTTYESCVWTAQQIHDIVPYLAAALTNAGVASTRIMLPEDATWDYDFSLATTAMSDSNTAAPVGILAAHDYSGTDTPLNNYGKPLWETEVSTFDTFDGSISNGLYWGSRIHSFMTVPQVNAWHFWWLIPYATDNESLVDTNGIPTKRMYVLGQYSRFVRSGFYRIGVSNGVATSISAYKDPNSGSFAVVAINNNNWDFVQTFNLSGITAASVTPWITSGSLSLASQPAVGVTNSTFVYTLPAMSIVTFTGTTTAGAPTLAIQRNGSQIGLTVGGNAGWNYSLLTSTNLSGWQLLLLTNSPVMPITWSDTNPISNARFYRVRLGQ